MASGRISSRVVFVMASAAAGLLLCPACRSRTDSQQVTAYVYDRDFEPGDRITDADLVKISIPRDIAERLGRIIAEDQKDAIAVDSVICRKVSKGDFVKDEHFAWDGPLDGLNRREIAATIEVDPKSTAGEVLRIGDYVNLLGMLPVKGDSGQYKRYRIIEWLQVLGIGEQTKRGISGGGRPGDAKSAPRPYSAITVKMFREKPDVSLQWCNLQTYLKGLLTVEICPPKHFSKRGPNAGRINPALLHLTERPAGDPGDL